MADNKQRMLINASSKEEVRVAIIDDNNILFDLDIENFKRREAKKANLYIGIVTRVEPSLRAAFVDYGAKRQGFLPLKEIDPKYFSGENHSIHKEYDYDSLNIKELLKEGQKILVQIDKEERGNKGAALSTYVSIAGRYMVLIPNNPKAGGISRRILGDERDELRQILSSVKIPNDMGVILRTAGVGHSVEDLQYDLDELVQLWSAIDKAAKQNSGPCLLHRESDIVIRSVRDYSLKNIRDIIIDNPEIYEKIKQYITFMHPDLAKIIKLYQGEVPLFAKYNIEHQIDAVFHNHVKLASGGSIVIDSTEALIAVDVNSSQATKGGDIEETAFTTNLEAAEEIARQLRIRDLGGLVVIDFIDMISMDHQRAVEDKMREAIHHDRARVQIGRISKFGLLEMSRQRLRPSLSENTKVTCPRCHGIGRIRTIESISLEAMRKIEEEIATTNCSAIQAFLPVDLAAFLANEKRATISELEHKTKIKILIIPDPYLESPDFVIKKIEGLKDPALQLPSYHFIPEPPEPRAHNMSQPAEEPLVQHNSGKSLNKNVNNTNLLKRVWNYLFIGEEEQKQEPEKNDAQHLPRKKQNMHKKHYADYSVHRLQQEQRIAEKNEDTEPKIMRDIEISVNQAKEDPNLRKLQPRRGSQQNRNRRRRQSRQQSEGQNNNPNQNFNPNSTFTPKVTAEKEEREITEIKKIEPIISNQHSSPAVAFEHQPQPQPQQDHQAEIQHVNGNTLEDKKHKKPEHNKNKNIGGRKRIYKKINKNKHKINDEGKNINDGNKPE